MVGLAKTNDTVVRLKGGDPFIFGRGGEELEVLKANDIPFQVVPGVTAANGCGAYAGIPLTHRDHTQAVTFVTGHGKHGKPDVDFKSLAKLQHTLVFYMGLKSFPTIASELIRHGKAPELPVAAIYKGTTHNQEVVIGTLQNLPEKTKQMRSPVLLIVGEVVALADSLAWFQTQAALGEIISDVNLRGKAYEQV